jgi:signal peptide peptidase SppA
VTSDLLQHREWLIEPDALHAMAATTRAFHDRGGNLPSSAQARSLLAIENGIGVVAIEGPILRKADPFARNYFGATDSGEIHQALKEASERPDIQAVFLDIDSPGGTVAGTPELAAAVASLNERKPVYAFSSGLMCSAAYWIASQARAIYATPSARVGSIGVVQAVIDNSAALDKAGLKVEVFSVGKYKAMGAPGTPLTDEQRELISSNLAEIASEFHAAVLAKGRAIPPEAMEGQTFSGRQAQRLNLAGVVPDRAEAMRRLRVYHAASVDTAARVMSNALEDQLAQARSQLAELQRDHQAQTELLHEESATVTSLRGEVETLAAQVESLTSERDAATGQVTGLQSRIAELESSQADFDRRVQTEVARIAAATGTTTPARITPAGDGQSPGATAGYEQLVAEYDRLISERKPEEAAAFFERHLKTFFPR